MVLLSVLVGYLIGSIPMAWIVTKLVTGRDLRDVGSGNVGVMNVALSVAGRQPLAQPSTPGYSNYLGGFTPAANMDFMASTYGPYAAASRPIVTQSQRPNYLGMAGSFLGGMGKMMTGFGAFS